MNFWNGTISKNGAHVTTKNPHYLNQMGIDIDETDVGVGYGIVANAATVSVEFGTEADQYFPSVFAFTMKTKDPSITIEKKVTDQYSPFNYLQINEELTYTLTGGNVGVGPAYNCVIVDTVPSNVTYVPNSIYVTSTPGVSTGTKTDAVGDDHAHMDISGGKTFIKYFIGAGATPTSGGILQPGQTYSVKFKVKSPSSGNLLSVVINTARITGESLAGDPYVDDATAIIGAEGGPLPVKMVSFTGKKENNNVVLKWITANEVINDKFEVEQSTDGYNFTTVGTVKGNGSTTQTSIYQFTGAITPGTQGVLYFRLKVTDENGKVSFTKIISVQLTTVGIVRSSNVYPNPFVNNIKVQVQNDREENAMVRITNQLGQLVVKKMVALQTGENVVVLKDVESLSKGVYNLEMITESGAVLRQKVIKQ